jgi:copper resistance protein C
VVTVCRTVSQTAKRYSWGSILTLSIMRFSQVMQMKRISVAALVACAALLLPRIALAHAHLLSSAPAASATVHGPDVAIELRFNSRVDGRHSVLTLVMADGRTAAVFLDNQSAENNLKAHAALKPGNYTLRWQALSTDGHITRGEIPFTVR